MRAGLALICIACISWSAVVRADETPWSKGVSDEQKATAERLLGEGNALFVQNQFREALEKYEAAVAAWDHPAIRFNMVRTLIALDRPLDAQKSLEKALAYGKEPIVEHYTEALNYQRLIASQIANVEVACKQQGVTVKLDGMPLVACPGRATKDVLPGNHVIVGARPGYQTQTRDLVLLGGKKQPIVIELVTIEQATVYKTRWKVWKPWAVIGGGVALAGAGLLLDMQARREMEQLGRSIRATCPASGCTAEQYDELGHARAESRALAENRVAIGMMVAGGAVVAAGVVGVILNRPRAYLTERRTASATASLVPAITADGAGLAVAGRF